MSEGPRITLAQGRLLASSLLDLWGLTGLVGEGGVHVVGSIRRQKPEVGDVEIIAPWPEPPAADPLFDRLAETLIADGQAPEPNPLVGPRRLVYAKSGAKRWFKACNLRVPCLKWPGQPLVGVQIYRYRPHNFGWTMLMRTGPSEFGMWFLGIWKRRMNIPRGHQASLDGCLVSAAGDVVPTPTEADCFRLAGLQYVAPEARESFAAANTREGRGRSRERWPA